MVWVNRKKLLCLTARQYWVTDRQRSPCFASARLIDSAKAAERCWLLRSNFCDNRFAARDDDLRHQRTYVTCWHWLFITYNHLFLWGLWAFFVSWFASTVIYIVGKHASVYDFILWKSYTYNLKRWTTLPCGKGDRKIVHRICPDESGMADINSIHLVAVAGQISRSDYNRVQDRWKSSIKKKRHQCGFPPFLHTLPWLPRFVSTVEREPCNVSPYAT